MGGAAAAPRGKRPVGVPAPDAEESRARRGENRVEDALADAVVKAVQDTGGYGGAVYLRSRDRRSLVLCVMSGVCPLAAEAVVADPGERRAADV